MHVDMQMVISEKVGSIHFAAAEHAEAKVSMHGMFLGLEQGES